MSGLAAASLLLSCTSREPADGGSPGDPRFPTGQLALVEEVSEAAPSVLSLSVLHGACDELVPWHRESVERVELAVLAPLRPVEGECGDVGLVDVVEVELAEPLGDRLLVVEVPPPQFDRSGEGAVPCFHRPHPGWCQEVLVRSAGRELSVGAPDYPAAPVDVTMEAGTTRLALSGGVVVEVVAPELLERPYLFDRRSLWRPDLDLWGSLGVHNVERPLDEAAALDHDVAGYPAYRVTPPTGPTDPADSVTVRVGPWSVDVTLWTKDPGRQRATLETFLDGLRIEARPGDLPAVVDSTGWASDSQELIVVDAGGSGFTFALAPNCDPATDPFCQPGAGHVGPPTPVVAEAAGVVELVYPPTEVEAGLAQPPSGTAVRPVDLGTLGDLVACSGVPAFDPALLPAGVGHEEAQRAVQVCTGISTWHGRSRPGVETAFTGQPAAPEVVATYERGDDGAWRATSVTSCR